MYIHGSYYNEQNEEVKVLIVTGGNTSPELEIGGDASGISFSDYPVEITSQVNDTFDHLLISQASIRLLCENFVPEFFCNSCREAVVVIYRGGECVFAGFIEPQALSQPYNDDQDEVELTCVDVLGSLQYAKYKGIGSLGVSYDAVKAKASQQSLLSIVGEIINGTAASIRDITATAMSVYYDGSKAVDAQSIHRYSVFGDISISELLFLGDEESDVWTHEEVLTEVLKYLNLHIVQYGLSFYIFSWESVRSADDIVFRELFGSSVTVAEKRMESITTSSVADCDTTISIEGTYNQLLLTDSVTEVESVVESPLDDSSLIANGNFQKYMTEYISEGEGHKAHNAMRAMVTGGSTDWEDASQVDWFAWPKNAKNWKFYGCGDRSDIYSKYPADGSNQQDILNKGLTSGIGACICAFGKIEKKNGGNDNSPVTSVSMENYLVISTGGNDGSGSARQPTESGILKACPVAEYTGNKSGGTFSPADTDTVNYIVISGKMVLNPLMAVTAPYGKMSDAATWDDNRYWHNTVPSRNDKYGRYYTRRYWRSASWNQEVTDDTDANQKTYLSTFYPYTGTGPQECEFQYSAVNTASDTIKKVGLVACMLIIGTKCVVEKQKGEYLGTNVAGTGEGDPGDFVWMDYKERSSCSSDEEYYAQSFTIGIDPKLKDCILGTEFDIQKNAPYTLGITAEGTAIPIRMSDHVSGQVRFLILGPVNAEWNQITRRHPSFWRHTKWYSDSVLLLSKANSIMLKDFKVEVVSDNGKIGAVGDESDIVYMSDTKESFVNTKDDIEFKITTALTSEECRQIGVNNAVKLSSPQNMLTQNALLTIHDWNTGETAKPEQIYVDAYWKEWHEPRVKMEQNHMDDGHVSPFYLYGSPANDKFFHVQGISRDLTAGTAKLTLKETF